MVFAIVLIGSQAAFAAPAAHFPTQVQTPPIQMTGRGYVPAPTPSPHVMEGHFPANVTTGGLVMTGRGYVPAPTPSPHVMEGHFPTAITVPSILMTGNRGS
jgi:hypothetical protein